MSCDTRRSRVAVHGEEKWHPEWSRARPSGEPEPGPVPIPMQDGTPPARAALRFVSFNCLAPANLALHRELLYRDSPPSALEPRARLARLVSSVLALQADVIGLQEIDPVDFAQAWEPHLAERGYRGVFKQRTGGQADGVALFWRDARLECETCEAVEFEALHASNPRPHHYPHPHPHPDPHPDPHPRSSASRRSSMTHAPRPPSSRAS